ncbi:MAG: hypothetical protein Fur0034_09270 [Desulfuromonadia bacterium]
MESNPFDTTPPGSPSILLVEDDPDDIYLTIRVLRGCGLETIEVVSDGFTALDRLMGHGTTTPFDLLITDLNLPGISGIELITRLKGAPRHPPLPSIVLTSSIDPFHRQTCEALGVVAFLSKPPLPDQLVEAIGRALRQGNDR